MPADAAMTVWLAGANVLVNRLIGREKAFDGVRHWHRIVHMQMVAPRQPGHLHVAQSLDAVIEAPVAAEPLVPQHQQGGRGDALDETFDLIVGEPQ